MATAETRQKLTSGGMFFLPVLLVLATAKLIAPPAVTSVEAALASVDPEDVAAASRRSATPEQVAASAHIERLRGEPFGRTPLYYPTARDDGTTEAPQRPDGVPPFRVRAILVSPRGNTAVIDGHVRRIGETLDETGWTIADVSADERSVTIVHERTKRRVTLAVDASAAEAGRR